MKKYILIYTTQLFYDSHGESDFGGITYKVEYSEKYNNLVIDPQICYNEELEIDNDEKEYYSEDGYNCEKIHNYFKELTEEEYNLYSKIIKDYENLNKLFN